MNSNTIWLSRVCGALALLMLSVSPCLADLFAVQTFGTEILRLDSTTGALIDSYLIEPVFPTPVMVNTGLAFDGRQLYMNRRLSPGFEELWALELATRSWYPVGVLDIYPVDPTASIQLSGLAAMPDAFGFPSVTAVSARTTNVASHVVNFALFPPFGPIFPTLPAGALPADFDADGADYDPSSNELWVAGEHVNGQTRTPMLLRTDLAGNIISTLSPSLGPATIPRGLAFDDGKMFLAARHLPTATNEVHEIDRATGAVLNTFVVPGNVLAAGGTIAALTGGTVIPEPTTTALTIAVVIFTAARRRTCR